MRPWRREPVDLVANQMAELEERSTTELARLLATKTDWTLTASGGWCAPTETIYSMPEFIVRRGGVRHD